MRNAIVTILVICSTLATAYGQIRPDIEQLEAWQQFKAQHGQEWQLRWNTRTGTPASVYLGLSKVYGGSPVEIARSFMSENSRIFKTGAGLAKLQHIRTIEHNGVSNVKLQQVHAGIPVWGHQYSVSVRSSGQVDMVTGSFSPRIDVPVTPALTWERAMAAAKSALEESAEIRGDVKNRLVIYPYNDDFHLAWQLNFSSTNPNGEWIAFVDARSGEFLLLIDNIRHADGKVSLINPGYSLYKPNKILPRQSGDYLDGTYAAVYTHRGPRAKKSGGNFRFTPTTFEHNTALDTSGFDQVNAYYHIDKFRNDYVQGTLDAGFTLNDSDLTDFGHGSDTIYVYTHSTIILPDDAGFDPADHSIHLGDGYADGPGETYIRRNKSNDFAKEAKVLYHEYGHVLSYFIADIDITLRTEYGAISEGGSDYFSGAFADNLSWGDTEATRFIYWATNCDSFPLLCASRDLDDPGIDNYASYRPNLTQNHEGGEFFSAVLWDLREHASITKTKADKLVYGALYRIATRPSFLDYRDAMMAEDNAENSGTHVSTIEAVFAARGIPPPDLPPPAPTGLTLTNAGQINQNPNLSWNAVNVSDLKNYEIFRCDRLVLDGEIVGGVCYPSDYNLVGTTTATSFTDGSVDMSAPEDADNYATYHVKAVDDANQRSGPSNTVNTYTGMGFEKKIGGVLAESLPEVFNLGAAHPNPFNPVTTIDYALPEASQVQLIVYNLAGRMVTTLVSANVDGGYRSVVWQGRDAAGRPVPSGVYLYRIVVTGLVSGERFIQTRKMVLLK